MRGEQGVRSDRWLSSMGNILWGSSLELRTHYGVFIFLAERLVLHRFIRSMLLSAIIDVPGWHLHIRWRLLIPVAANHLLCLINLALTVSAVLHVASNLTTSMSRITFSLC